MLALQMSHGARRDLAVDYRGSLCGGVGSRRKLRNVRKGTQRDFHHLAISVEWVYLKCKSKSAFCASSELSMTPLCLPVVFVQRCLPEASFHGEQRCRRTAACTWALAGV